MTGIRLFILSIYTCYYRNIDVRTATYAFLRNFPDTDCALHETIFKAANSSSDAQFDFSVWTSSHETDNYI
jgi:hypothetical protein